jgi:hypothetical protein
MATFHATTRRVYVDASVFGGAFDEEFQEDSCAFFDQVAQGRFKLLTSVVVAEELRGGPREVQELFEGLLASAELIRIDEKAIKLQAAYFDARILTQKWANDALHVTLATTASADLIVSWNFRHIVHFEKVIKYNAVNVLHGFREVAIHSPSGVIAYEDDEEI